MKAVLKRKYILISLVGSAMLSLAGIIFYMSQTPVTQYPSLSYSFNVPTTEADVIREQFDNIEIFPDITDPIKKMAEIKYFVSYRIKELQMAGKDINEVKLELIQAEQSVTWQCDIENNVEVEKPLIPESFLILYYGLESYNTGVTLDKIQLGNEDHKLILNSARTTMQNYSSKGFFGYTMYCYSRFKIDQLPDDTELTGITIGLWKYYNINSKYKTELKIEDLWNKQGKPLSNELLEKLKIELSIDKLIPGSKWNKEKIMLNIKKPYYSEIKFKLKQGKTQFNFPGKNRILSRSGKYIWKDNFDFNKKAELTVIINTQIPAGTTELVVKNTE